MISRRNFLRTTPLAAASGIGFPHVAQSAERLRSKPGARPKHIIHMVADGMSAGTLTCADHLSRYLRNRGLAWMNMYKSPHVQAGLMNMRSLNSLVTDSSAASSSWGSGTRIINGVVNQMGDGTNLQTLYQLFDQAGWKRGLVTTTEITHATPAGFVANVESRDKASIIAAQYLERRVDVLLGGGQKYFDRKERKDKRDLYADYAAAGYRVMKTLDELRAADNSGRWLGVFSKEHLPFTLDHTRDEKKVSTVPTLAVMTAAALKRLEKEKHFILQVEGGRVDHGCHNCDAAAALYDQVAFDEAIEVCLDFQKRMPDTLIVITTDHGNSNLGLNGMGSGYGQSTWLFKNLLNIKRSFPEILKLVRKSEKVKPDKLSEAEEKARQMNPKAHPDLQPLLEIDSDEGKEEEDEEKKKEKEVFYVKSTKEIIDVIEESTGYRMPERRAEMLAPHLSKKGSALYDAMRTDICALGQAMANYLGIGFTSNAHTADYVPIVATGPGSEKFRGFIENTDIFYHYLSMARIDYRNPSEPLITEFAPEAGQVEDTGKYAEV
jgi:alkaline phosphatase